MANLEIIFLPQADEDYEYWENHDLKIKQKIDLLIADINRNKYKGLGKPEALKYQLSGWWSRRIDKQHRLVYKVEENGDIVILQCRFHY